MRAQKAAQVGALQLVPPICCVSPWKMMNAPVSGAATSETSGTSRSVPVGTPVPVCHGGREKKMLFPPPLPIQPISSATAPARLSVKLVPPTATTYGEVDWNSACKGPSELCPVSPGVEPASPVDTKTLTPRAA